MDNMAKCRKNRGETGFLPPPGGAQAADNVTSCQQQKAPQLYIKNIIGIINKKIFKKLLTIIMKYHKNYTSENIIQNV